MSSFINNVMDFREFYKLNEGQNDSWAPLGMIVPTGPFGALPAQWTGSQASDQPLRSGGYMGTNWVNGDFDLMLPSVTKVAKILRIDEKKKKNAVLIFLADKDIPTLDIPYDTYKKIIVPPEVGRTIMVRFQRRTDDTSPNPANIKNIRCY